MRDLLHLLVLVLRCMICPWQRCLSIGHAHVGNDGYGWRSSCVMQIKGEVGIASLAF